MAGGSTAISLPSTKASSSSTRSGAAFSAGASMCVSIAMRSCESSSTTVQRERATGDAAAGRDRAADADAGRDRDQRERPPGLRERDVTVDAATAWRDTGIDLRAGQTVYFSASGRVRWGPDRQDGPEGEHGSPYNAGRPIPGRPAAALVGRVGEGSDNFFIGDDKGPVRVRASGRLYLGINDDFLKDNSGSFRVTVYY